MIPGNHDFLFEENFSLCNLLCKEKNIICLNDSVSFLPRKLQNIIPEKFNPETTIIDGGRIKIWGSPMVPYIWGVFNKFRGDQIQHHWDLIPDNLDILITHGPAAKLGTLSQVLNGEDVGCEIYTTLF